MKRAYFAPEVIQTSAMDCGPAALKTLLEGHRIPVAYGRLREACQTDVDGTSIDTLEQAAVDLGLDAVQVMIPVDHVGRPESTLLPCLAVVQQPGGSTHFVVAWRRHGPWLQIMDPAVGRKWISVEAFRASLYRHTAQVPAEAWRAWAGSEAFAATLDAQLEELGAGADLRRELLERAIADPDWTGCGQLDGAVRMTAALLRGRAVVRGREAAAMVERLARPGTPIPDAYRSARPDPREEGGLLFSGAVLVTVAGRLEVGPEPRAISPELAAALRPDTVPARAHLLGLARRDGLLEPAALLGALCLSGAAVVVEALLLRGLLDLGGELVISGQRLGMLAAVLGFLMALAILEWPLAASLLRMGRKLEGRLRAAFLAKIPRLGDRYFQSRLVSDMAERSHAVHVVRALPELAGQLLRTGFEMVFTVIAIGWLYPRSLPVALTLAAAAVAIPLLAQPFLAERDLRWRTHGGALSRFYLDALQGLVAIRAHGAERALRREQEENLARWAEAGLAAQKLAVAVEGLQSLTSLGLAAWLLLAHLRGGGDPAAVLLLAYWALNLPALGQEFCAVARQYPGLRNVTLRLLEPLGAPEEPAAPETPAPPGGVSIVFEGLSVRAAGHRILEGVDLRIAPGEQVGIVGASGAGKSTLAGLLLGWHRPSEGRFQVDGAPPDPGSLAALRRATAWVDPQVQVWNRSLLENLRYGCGQGSAPGIETALDGADLRGVLRRLPDGLQTVLGESGALVSGGEGQRVRFGRALLRDGVRLAILDEPARGLDRGRRRALLDQARSAWPGATLLCITHDVADTLEFSRVLVVEQGRLVEDGNPRDLAGDPDSRYRALLDAEKAVREDIWSGPAWRRLRMEAGRVEEVSCETS
ncbi:MAG: ATP-binding cassette domain-containing protein [Acidobacteria bacterium]|nr:ATP-binding cassette domain-containing protein [Acidobacteriota bacterium]